MAFNVADPVIGLGLLIAILGIAVGGIGLALGTLVIPSLARRFRVEPVAVPTLLFLPLAERGRPQPRPPWEWRPWIGRHSHIHTWDRLGCVFEPHRGTRC